MCSGSEAGSYVRLIDCCRLLAGAAFTVEMLQVAAWPTPCELVFCSLTGSCVLGLVFCRRLTGSCDLNTLTTPRLLAGAAFTIEMLQVVRVITQPRYGWTDESKDMARW